MTTRAAYHRPSEAGKSTKHARLPWVGSPAPRKYGALHQMQPSDEGIAAEALAEEEAKQLAPLPASAPEEPPPFVYIHSTLVDENSGNPRESGVFWRGDRLLETMEFKVNQQVDDVQLHVSTSRKVMGAWMVVHTPPPVPMGSYAPREEPYTFRVPPSDVPSGPASFAACGRYRAVVTIRASNFEHPIHERVAEVEIR